MERIDFQIAVLRNWQFEREGEIRLQNLRLHDPRLPTAKISAVKFWILRATASGLAF